MDEQERQPFMTRDIYLAATLVTLHFPLLGTDFQQEGIKQRMIGYFKFQDTPQLRETRNDYNQSLLLVEPKLYMSNLQSLKAEVVNFEFNPESKFNKNNAV